MKKHLKFLLSIILISALAFLLYFTRWHLIESPINLNFLPDSPLFSISDSNDNIYFIDTAKRRIVKTTPEGELSYVINGGQKVENNFFYATDITVDDNGQLYVINQLLDEGGFFVTKEEIQKYSSEGKFLETIYKKEYKEKKSTLVQRGQLKKLKHSKGSVSWFDLDENKITLNEYNISSSKTKIKATIPFTEANILISDIVQLDNSTWAYINKNGTLNTININSKKIEVIFKSKKTDINEISVPWSIDIDSNGNLYFSDITQAKIYRISKDYEMEEYFSDLVLNQNGIEVESMIYYRFSISDSALTTCNYEALVQFKPSGVVYIDSIKLSKHFIIMKVLSLLLAVFLLGSLFYCLKILYVDIFNKELPKIITNTLLVLIIIGITTALIVTVVLKNFSERYTASLLEKTSQMVQLFPNSVNGNLFNKLNGPGQYMNEEYREIRDSFHNVLNDNKDPWNNRYYYAIYRVFNKNTYGFMFLNDEITPFQPFDYYEEGGAYQIAHNGEIMAETDSDSWGTWIYAVGPIKDSSGKVVALLEVGTDLYSFQQENKKLFKSLIIDVITLIMVFVLILIEFLFFHDLLFKKDHYKTDRRVSYTQSNLSRPINFLFTFAVSMSLAFVPVMMKELYEPLFSLKENVVIALPISLEMLFFVFGLIISGKIVQKNKWKFILFSGIVVGSVGLLLSALSKNMYMFFAARSIVGFASGSVLISLRSIISAEPDPEKKSASYSHFYSGAMAGLNVGVFFGAFLADQIGFYNVFFFAFVVLIFTGVISFQLIGDVEIEKIPASINKALTAKIFLNPKVLLFFLLIIIPTYTAGMFMVYYFPLFATENGISVSNIGRLFILNGILIIYLGPELSKFLKKTIGDRASLFIGSFGWAAALFVFAITGSIFGAIITIIIMGITEGFCVTAQNNYYLDMKEVKQAGEEKSIAYFEIFAKAAEFIAPILFGISITMANPLQGISILTIIIIVLTFIYLPFLIIKSKDRGINK